MKKSPFFDKICRFWNHQLHRFQKDEQKYTRIVYNAVLVLFLICVVANFLFYEIESMQGILINVLSFGFGLMLGVILYHRAIRKDMDNVRKQIEAREKREKEGS